MYTYMYITSTYLSISIDYPCLHNISTEIPFLHFYMLTLVNTAELLIIILNNTLHCYLFFLLFLPIFSPTWTSPRLLVPYFCNLPFLTLTMFYTSPFLRYYFIKFLFSHIFDHFSLPPLLTPLSTPPS